MPSPMAIVILILIDMARIEIDNN